MGNKTDSISFSTGILLLVIGIAVNAYIISYFYEWFLIKPFVLPKLNLWQFAGLSTFYAFMSIRNEKPEQRANNSLLCRNKKTKKNRT